MSIVTGAGIMIAILGMGLLLALFLMAVIDIIYSLTEKSNDY
jgi:hypothetical protein